MHQDQLVQQPNYFLIHAEYCHKELNSLAMTYEKTEMHDWKMAQEDEDDEVLKMATKKVTYP